MGYRSTFDVYSNATESKHKEIIRDFKSWCEDADWVLLDNGYSQDIIKWYNFDSDIRKLSNKYPDVLFECYRSGEDPDDFEKIYAKGGKLQSVMGIVEYPDFNEEELV